MDGAQIFHKLWVIESLRMGELRTGRNLVQGKLSESKQKHPHLEIGYDTPATKEELFQVLQAILRDAKLGIYSIIHFECHGSPVGLSTSRGDLVKWDDLRIILIEINRASRLNLLVVLAACNGIHLIKVATQLDQAPFWAVIGPEREVTAGAVERDFGEFYDELFETFDGDAALNALNKYSAGSSTYKFVNARDIFIKAYADYYKKHCVGKGKQRRKEELLTLALQRPPIHTMGAKLVRQLVKQGLSKENEEQHFNKKRDDFFFIKSFPENAKRFSVFYQDVLVQAGLQ